jgi:hypothetical protein
LVPWSRQSPNAQNFRFFSLLMDRHKGLGRLLIPCEFTIQPLQPLAALQAVPTALARARYSGSTTRP